MNRCEYLLFGQIAARNRSPGTFNCGVVAARELLPYVLCRFAGTSCVSRGESISGQVALPPPASVGTERGGRGGRSGDKGGGNNLI